MSRYFTENPIERDMQRKPKPQNPENLPMRGDDPCRGCSYHQDVACLWYCLRKINLEMEVKNDK